MILTGFYNVDILSEDQQKKLMEDAMYLSFKIEVNSKYSNRNNWRDIEPSISIKEALDICSSLKMVDRSIQRPENDDTLQGEISLVNISWGKQYNNKGWLLLYCYLSRSNLQLLARKYNLEMQ